jgi:hypothetical protein
MWESGMCIAEPSSLLFARKTENVIPIAGVVTVLAGRKVGSGSHRGSGTYAWNGGMS